MHVDLPLVIPLDRVPVVDTLEPSGAYCGDWELQLHRKEGVR